MIEERFKIGKWKLIDIVFGEGICENCRKPITYLYFIEDEQGNKCAVGSECFKQIVREIPPKARQYIDLKERVLGNVDVVLKNNVQAIKYGRNLGARVEEPGLAVFGYPTVVINNKFYSATALKIFFKTGRTREPRFDVEEETINELIRLGWKEYQAPRGAFGHVTDRFIILNPATAQQLEGTLISQGWKIYDNPKKRYRIGYYREQLSQRSFDIEEAIDETMKLLVRGYTWKTRMLTGAVFEWWTPQKVNRQTAKEELLNIANREYGVIYTQKDIVSIWETQGGI